MKIRRSWCLGKISLIVILILTNVLLVFKGVRVVHAIDGDVDISFDAALSPYPSTVHDLVIQPDGKVLIAGYFSSVQGIRRPNLVRLNVDGTIDQSFKAEGTGREEIGSEVTAMALQPDGKIVIGGYFSSSAGWPFSEHIARLNSDGSLDPTFRASLGDNTFGSYVNVIVAQPNGSILVGGGFNQVNGVRQIGLARLNADGTTDSAFVPSTYVSYVNDIKVLANGQLLVG